MKAIPFVNVPPAMARDAAPASVSSASSTCVSSALSRTDPRTSTALDSVSPWSTLRSPEGNVSAKFC